MSRAYPKWMPKLDFVLTDAIGREWQCGTFQADFNLPQRLSAEYIDNVGNKQMPVMIHRAILGSFERFIGILIENYSGKLPFWLAPIQVAITTIVSDADEFAISIFNKLRAKGIRPVLDTRNEKISYKVREHSTSKIPYIISIGKKEIEAKTVSLRKLGSKDTQIISLDEFLKEVQDLAANPA